VQAGEPLGDAAKIRKWGEKNGSTDFKRDFKKASKLVKKGQD
jgi:hypothetical protein